MAMDWSEIQYRIRDYFPRIVTNRALDSARAEIAKAADNGVMAAGIDAVIRAISRRDRDPEGIYAGELDARLSDLEKDVLGVRLSWAMELSTVKMMQPGPTAEWPFGGVLSEEEFEGLLIEQWQKAKENYDFRKMKIVQPQTKNIPPDRGGSLGGGIR